MEAKLNKSRAWRRQRENMGATVDDNKANVCWFPAGNFAEARANRCVFENIKYCVPPPPSFPSRFTLQCPYGPHFVSALWS